jgi:hypothetical protein
MERLFGAIPAVLSSLGSNAEVDEAMVFAAWKSCAGDMLSERTAPLEFFENRLVVAVADETWRRHLEDLAPQMLHKLNGRLEQGTVTFIEFVIDPAVIRSKAKTTDVADSEIPEEIDASLANAAAAISDEKLRQQFINTAATYLARQKHLK